MTALRIMVCAAGMLMAGFPLYAGEPAGEPPTIDSKFRELAPSILKYAKEHNCTAIGTLKFMVKVGDAPASDNVGPLNLGLSNRLTVALVLACNDSRFGIIRDANSEAQEISEANHLTEKGRTALFDHEYNLAWYTRKATSKPGLFVTGEATLSKDLSKTTIELVVFGEDGKLDKSLGGFTVDTTARTLVETGHSYLLTKENSPQLFNPELLAGARGPVKGQLNKDATNHAQKVADTLATAEKADKAEKLAALLEKDSPVKVTLFYNGEKIPVVGGAVREPNEKEKVWFHLENTSNDTCGVVVKVNGVNSIFKEKLPDVDCHKWILGPKQVVIVRGFQVKSNKREPFKVLSQAESKANEIRYGEYTGTFQISVFTSKPSKEPDRVVKDFVLKDDEHAVAAIGRGTLDVVDVRPGSMEALKAKFNARVVEYLKTEDSRGIVDGDTQNIQDHEVTEIKFKPNPPGPVFSYSIRYYLPK